MKFNETLLHRTLIFPIDYAEKHCGYYWVLCLPYFALLYLIGIPLAIIIDLFTAIGKAH